MSEIVYDLKKLERLWDRGLTHLEIAQSLGCSVRYVDRLRVRHNLPARDRRYHASEFRDPTPLEIEERKKEILERHLAQKLREM